METLTIPVSKIVTEISIPVYFVMGKYDCMTSPEAAKEYLNTVKGQSTKEIVIFEAHYPQFEEKEKCNKWMCGIFADKYVIE